MAKAVWKQLGPTIRRRYDPSPFSAGQYHPSDIEQYRDHGDYDFRLVILPSGKHRVRAGCQDKTIEHYRIHVAEQIGQFPQLRAKGYATLLILSIFEDLLNDHLAKLKKRKAAARKKARAAK